MLTALPKSTEDNASDKHLNNRIMSDLKQKTFEQWYKEKYDPTGYLYPSAPLSIGFQDYCARVDEYLQYLANEANTGDSGLHLQRVSFNEAEYCTKCGKRKKMKGDGTLELLCECSEVEVCPDCGYEYQGMHDKGWHNKTVHGKDWQT